jgi:peptidoglycan/xylan/chitin deacetylase (PgdA/CDA1 family)
MMTMEISRRDFIKHTGVAVAGLALSACQPARITHVPASAQAGTATPAPTAQRSQTLNPTSTSTAAPTFCPDQISQLVSQEEAAFLAAHEVRIGDTTRPVMMMTYDDNGSYNDVRTILDAFNAYGMKTTFFFIGEKIPLSSKAVHAVVDEGHLLACHGYAHQDFVTLTDDQINRRVEKSFRAVADVVPGYRMRFIRFPYGSGVGSERILRVVAQWGLQHIYWSTGSNGTIPDTLGTVMRNAENGGIVLSHMHRYYDLAQAAQIVENLVAAGYSLETVETGRAPEDVFQA